MSSFVVFPLLGISGSDFSTLDLVSVLASLPFHGRGGEKEGGVPSQFESLISELNATAGRCRPRRGIRPSLRQRRLRLLKPGGGAVVNLSSGGGGGGGEDFTDAALDTAGAEQRAAYEAAVVAHEEEEVRTVRSTVPRGEYQRRGAQHVHAFFYPVQTLGETPPGAHQFVRIEYQRRGNPHGFRPGVPSTIE